MNIYKKGFSIIFLLFLFLFLPKITLAENASIFFSPSSGQYSLGQKFSVNILVSSKDTPINAVSGSVNFDSNKLEVVSLSTASSIVNLWTNQPNFSNSSGTINFEGIVLNPGFVGSSAKVITITFRSKTQGDASISLKNISILANDGLGTNITGGIGNGKYNFKESEEETKQIENPIEDQKVSDNQPKINIYSETHSNENEWYSENNFKVAWNDANNYISSSVLLDKNPVSIPTLVSTPAIGSTSYSNLSNGLWYFHLRLKDDKGWTDTMNFKVRIDKEKPEQVTIKEVARINESEPTVKFIFSSKDNVSGIDYYEISLDSKEYKAWENDGTKQVFETPILEPGNYNIIIKAFDKAKNYSIGSLNFYIKPLNTPIINDYPRGLSKGDNLFVRGVSYPNSSVELFIQKDNESIELKILKTDNNGNFSYLYDNRIKNGVYKIWARALSENGGRSEYTDKISILVDQPNMLQIGSLSVDSLAIFIPLVALITLLTFLSLKGLHNTKKLKKKLSKEVSDVETSLYKYFEILKSDMSEGIKILVKNKKNIVLSKKDLEFIKKFKSDILEAENTINKEMKDVNRKIK